MKYVIYFAHGTERYTNEALYSILSFWRHHSASDYTIAIVTDNTAPFEQRLGCTQLVKYIPVTRDQIREWTGPQHYIHRAKPLAIQHAADLLRTQYPDNDDAFLFVDTDTAFTSSIEDVFPQIKQGAFFFHVAEKTIENGGASPGRRHGEFRELCLSASYDLKNKRIRLPASLMISNCGVIGFNAEHLAIFTDTCELIDQLYAKFPQPTTEQTAISWALQMSNNQPRYIGDAVFHYWYFKEFSADIAEFFKHYQNDSLDVLIARCHEIDPQIRYIPKRQFSRHHRMYRSLCKYFGRTWTPSQFPWESTAPEKQGLKTEFGPTLPIELEHPTPTYRAHAKSQPTH